MSEINRVIVDAIPPIIDGNFIDQPDIEELAERICEEAGIGEIVDSLRELVFLHERDQNGSPPTYAEWGEAVARGQEALQIISGETGRSFGV